MTLTGSALAPVGLAGPEDLRVLMRLEYTPSDQQWAAISAPLSPAVVVAGAGSGKTSVMAARVVYLVATGQVRPEQVLGLTFTTKAASELGTRIRQALEAAGLSRGEDGERAEPTVATYNAYAASLLAEHGLRIGHEPDTRVLADASRYQLAGRAMQRHTGPVRRLTESPPHVLDYLLALDAAMSEHLVPVERVRAFHARERPLFEAALDGSRARTELETALNKIDEREELLDLVEAYRRLKGHHGLLDFSDQIALAARLADEYPQVARTEREKYSVVLLDEYQDTSVAQARLLGRLFSGADVAHGRGHPVTAVGDPNQAIYGWRGASVSNILDFADTFPAAEPGSPATYPLSVNRRSDRRILEAANRLAQPLYAASPVVRPLEPGADAADGQVEVSVHETQAAELAWLADRVLEARAAGTPWREIGVLTRDNDTAAAVFDALTAREIPVEIVGLKGLLRLPEVAEVVATLTLLVDLTANDALLLLLSGPRWAIGPRDLALLGQRARRLAERRPRQTGLTLAEELAQAVAGADPTEIVCLTDALEDPGRLSYSAAARDRFGLLAAELRMLRAHAGEPLLDLVRLIIDTTGIDVELASSVSPAAAARRDNLDLFVKAVADFQAVDGAVTLTALLAYLTAEDELGEGLDVATPSEADSVKLLTVHRAKGLEWDVVFCVGVCEGKFPVGRARSQWTTSAKVLPAPLRGDAPDVPQLRGHDAAALRDLGQEARRHEATEELRLAYVAFTRARHRLSVSSYRWHASRSTPLEPSSYQLLVRDALADWGQAPSPWTEPPAAGEPNPLRGLVAARPWPVTERTAEALRRLEAAELVTAELAAAELAAGESVAGAGPAEADDGLDMLEAARVATWDAELDRLVEETRRERSRVVDVPLPSSLSATSLARLRADPEGFARDLARPMPRPPSPAAAFGTRFHAWVEARFGQQDLFDPEDLPGRGDAGIDSESDLAELVAAFEAGPFAERTPYAVEQPFALVLAGQVVRGRIDAVYADPDGGFLLVDWKTGRTEDSDPLQLAVYRLAWAELAGVDPGQVRAGFYYVRTGRLVTPIALPGRSELEALLRSAAGPR